MITVVLPWPAKQLWSNRNHGTHWAVAARFTATARHEAWTLTLQALGDLRPAITGARLVFTFHAPTRARYDIANALQACKAAIDGLADALAVNDAEFNPIELCRGEPVTGGQVRVEVYFQ